ncbi:MAG: hypothetical protein WCR19_01650, partial [Acholeplasmataceae bacterium]
TDDYKEYMKMLINKGMAKFGTNEGITINICACDEKYTKFLEENFPNNEVCITSSDIIGGVILIWGRKLIDCSISSFLQAEREGFLTMSGLSIY